MACKRSPVRLRYSPLIPGLFLVRDFFMYYTYIIYSAKLDRYYRGSTDNRAERLIDHNSGISKFTSKVSDWTLVYSEEYTTREEASFREREIKRKKSRNYIEWLIAGKPEAG